MPRVIGKSSGGVEGSVKVAELIPMVAVYGEDSLRSGRNDIDYGTRIFEWKGAIGLGSLGAGHRLVEAARLLDDHLLSNPPPASSGGLYLEFREYGYDDNVAGRLQKVVNKEVLLGRVHGSPQVLKLEEGQSLGSNFHMTRFFSGQGGSLSGDPKEPVRAHSFAFKYPLEGKAAEFIMDGLRMRPLFDGEKELLDTVMGLVVPYVDDKSHWSERGFRRFARLEREHFTGFIGELRGAFGVDEESLVERTIDIPAPKTFGGFSRFFKRRI